MKLDDVLAMAMVNICTYDWYQKYFSHQGWSFFDLEVDSNLYDDLLCHQDISDNLI